MSDDDDFLDKGKGKHRKAKMVKGREKKREKSNNCAKGGAGESFGSKVRLTMPCV